LRRTQFHEDSVLNIRARQKAATQASILQAALEIFSEQGFEGASTREIAAKAGVHHALIKYHFDNKDTLWRAAVSVPVQAPGRGAEAAGARRPGPCLVSRLRQGRDPLGGALFRPSSRTRPPDGPGERARQRAIPLGGRRVHRRDPQRRRALHRAVPEEGILPKVSVAASVYIFVGAAQLFYTLAPEVRRVWGLDPSDPKVIEDHAEALVAIMVR
jgi:TetR/AcrR family transcriptional regulator